MKNYRQGDLVLIQVDSIPKSFRVVQKMQDGCMELARHAAGQEYVLINGAVENLKINSPKKSTSAAILARALSLANDAMFTIGMQCRRLRSVEPEDKVFSLRWWADLQMLIGVLCRLRLAALAAGRAQGARVGKAIEAFEQAIPDLILMRDVAEHMDEYATDSGKRIHKTITRRMVQVGSWDGTTFSWIRNLDIDEARLAAQALFATLQKERDRLCKSSTN